jgi:hypothetical protein
MAKPSYLSTSRQSRANHPDFPSRALRNPTKSDIMEIWIIAIGDDMCTFEYICYLEEVSSLLNRPYNFS